VRNLAFSATKEVLDLGVKILTARITGVQNTDSNADFETYKDSELENNVICRLEVLQVEPTKVTAESKDVFMIIEGNANTDVEYVRSTAKEVCDLMTKHCGGSYSFLNDLN